MPAGKFNASEAIERTLAVQASLGEKAAEGCGFNTSIL